MAITDAQKRANKRQDEQRRGLPRLPASYITDEENELLLEMSKIYGSKKEAIFEGLSLLKKAQKGKNNS
ncbi:hypothetical protein [Gilliamella sp. Nev3-1]|uniref:hypothetical protein n=1 Tax=Gilliamella sp. Nev3-1 TaxID=3120250 RepID=UPI00080ECF18|nr:hypothetical protein [Gilliamella apicola]OCG58791.1 hypothetical protein A9G40_08285 [Gilliamella apicola]